MPPYRRRLCSRFESLQANQVSGMTKHESQCKIRVAVAPSSPFPCPRCRQDKVASLPAVALATVCLNRLGHRDPGNETP
eukprot:5673055-Amphidinium_carterae.1